ncbi:hypothetical protein BDN71DRAFT_218441 [Pleurotus eryngii]|uniref:Uncharacterized protein n=1 Tax=Pleurotus eryngii TaxID=5323 RepID=A0A9P6D3Y5_PLEER|nr:hypothetical protein BDN71DRAFT_218441 [Pleurotus eryngii]
MPPSMATYLLVSIATFPWYTTVGHFYWAIAFRQLSYLTSPPPQCPRHMYRSDSETASVVSCGGALYYLRLCFCSDSTPMDFRVGIIRHDHFPCQDWFPRLPSALHSTLSDRCWEFHISVANLGQQAPHAN